MRASAVIAGDAFGKIEGIKGVTKETVGAWQGCQCKGSVILVNDAFLFSIHSYEQPCRNIAANRWSVLFLEQSARAA
jgi:hypothetical protein